MLRKRLSQADIKSARADKIMDLCHRLARHNDTSNTLQNEIKLWIEALEKLQKRPDDVPSTEEIDSMSSMQLEELWLQIGMVKETILDEDFNRAVNQVKAEKSG